MDPQYAAEVLPYLDPDRAPVLTPQGLTLEVQAIRDQTDAIQNLTYVLMAVNAGKKKPPRPKPLPRPKTAIHAALADVERNEMHSLARMFLPHDDDN